MYSNVCTLVCMQTKPTVHETQTKGSFSRGPKPALNSGSRCPLSFVVHSSAIKKIIRP